MIMRRHLAAAALLAACFAPLAPTQSRAATLVVCAPEPAAGSTGPRSVTNPNTGNRYGLNGQGCAPMRFDDAAYFATRGFTQGLNSFQLFFSQRTTGFNFVLPASAFLRNFILSELSGNSVSNGICIGTTNGGSDVATQAGTASLLKVIPDSSVAKRVFSISAQQTIFFGGCDAAGLGSSKWDVTVEYGYF